MLQHHHIRTIGLLALVFALLGATGVRANEPVAHGILFFSPTCPHCHVVLDEVLPPLQARYGDQLAIAVIDVSQPAGQELYQAAVMAFQVTQERSGVPALIFGDQYLVGSIEIPQMLPILIDAALAAGGNTWPALPGFTPPAPAELQAPTAQATSPFQRDPLGNGIAVVMLVIMILSLFVVGIVRRSPLAQPLTAWRIQAVPALALVGMVVASYLAYVEVSGAAAVCGPVGDCNTVQQSEYAKLFGIPVGLLGIVGYTAILLAWAVSQYGSKSAMPQAATAMRVMIFGGMLFSTYLTFLEPFVIGATCAWCVASSAIMTALLWVTTARGKVAPAVRGRPRHGQVVR
ncbi:MAG: vitamin K epoxide reductase [Candidatus Viridilinea halotolerans]|uniref:Vitamin K epoxide reductase n=1 Tax=Candidatus Viridilinea halotolerans TaxID=2491704 RepID=A0A426TVV0_9CHLR|nr:MAG: vitamin K epoxide reductase [Candidatus Viridilinea halotolerans]